MTKVQTLIGKPSSARLILLFAFLAAFILLTNNRAPAANIIPIQSNDRPPVSTCMAIAQDLNRTPLIHRASYTKLTPQRHGPYLAQDQLELDTDLYRELTPFEVRIAFYNHSTYIIESHEGVTAATDYFGFAQYQGKALIPTIVTMNRAHSTHYTNNPDPRIQHVLPGWGETEPAAHMLQVEDMLVRNVTTDIVRGDFRQPNSNSIFIFEVAGLCIGHLGHLHHSLTDSHYAAIGRLDVMMVPIDGALTMSLAGMADIIKRVRARVILPMHARGFATPETLISMLGEGYESVYLSGTSVILTLNNLPRTPTVIVPRGL